MEVPPDTALPAKATAPHLPRGSALTARVSAARRRLLPAWLVSLTGALAVLGGLAPSSLVELVELSPSTSTSGLLIGRAVLVELGAVLLITGRMLGRGSRAAWLVAAAASLGVLLAEVLRERLGLVALLAAASLLSLLVSRSAFRLRFDTGRRLRRLWVPAFLLGLLFAYSLFVYAEVEALHARAFGARLTDILRTGVGAPGGIDVETTFAEAYVWSLRVGLILVVVGVFWALRRTPAGAPGGIAEARVHAERYGRSSTAPLLALPDNARLPLCNGQALAGMAVRNGVAISLGLPVAPDELEGQALKEFVAACEAAGWTPALLALDERQRETASGEGFSAVKIGEEAFLDVADFDTTGKRRANLRHSVTRARKDGVTVLRYDETCRTARRDSQLAAISAAWLADKGGPELGFTLGRFDLARLGDQEVYAALIGQDTHDEQVVGFVTWLPYENGDAAVLDLMRRGEPCPPGVMECLVVDALADFAARGRRTASLGGVPLAATTERTERTQQLMGWLYEHGGSVYAAKGLFRFKDKFAPRWEPMFMAYPSAADLPRIGLATLRAFLPSGAVREFLRRQPPAPSQAAPAPPQGPPS